MNQKTQKLREIVERATAAAESSPTGLDAETASLREGWLQLGRLIEEEIQAGAPVSGKALAAGGQPADRRFKTASAASPRRRSRTARSLWLVASAASLLVAFGAAMAVRFFSASQQPQANSQKLAAAPDACAPVASTAVAGTRDTHTAAAKPAVLPAIAPHAAPPPARSDANIAKSGEPLQWGDSVDEEITALGQATMYTQQGGPSSRVWEIEAGLDQLNREVEHNNL